MNFADKSRSVATPFRLDREQYIELPHGKVFEFFADPENLEAITPPWMQFRIVGCSTPEIEEGTVLDYALKVRGMPTKWRSLIREWNPPHSFIDEQLVGPYRRWIHLHTFEAQGSGTLIGDHVDYAVPGGKLIEKLLVQPELRRIFDYRQHSLPKLLQLD
ncbi:MAG: ligand-binding SRPBCC domain-containing protein [Planctomycetota bacterium]|jgi:ligand-binding SRPBCC domain-containing protein